MQKIYWSVILLFITLSGFSQQRYKITYQQLKEYEGQYEYINHATLKIAASPVDTLLYAIINESRYKLTPSGKDLFLNMGNETFKLLNKNVFFPTSIWYPRLASAKNFHYIW